MSGRHNVEDIYPLSPMQEGLLFHTLYAPESGMYVEQLIHRLHGGFNVLAFKQAWQKAIDRHPILRTAFAWERRDKPLQVVLRRVKLPIEQKNWRGLSSHEQEKRLEHFLREDRERGFELSKPPLMRLALIQVAEHAYQFILSYHHILLDAWSVYLILGEIYASYEALCQGQDVHLEPRRPYRDYIAWLRRQDLSRAETYWREMLTGFTKPTPLGMCRPYRNSVDQDGDYEDQEMRLSAATTAALNSFARRHQLTPNTLVQGTWALLLGRYSGEEDVAFGTTVSGRPASLQGAESMVGLFINTLPLRVQMSPQDSLLPWLKRLQAQQLGLQEYVYSPLVQIQGWSDVPRGMPLFESMLDVWDVPGAEALQKWNRSLEIHDTRYLFKTNYPLTVGIEPGRELSVRIMYDCHRFDAATITRMLGHFRTLLESTVADPEQRLSDLTPLTKAERHQLLMEWNDTQINYPKDKCIHELFEAQVEQTPDAVAVTFEEERLTYRELNRRANQLAHHLRSLGVGPDVLVGICVERSLELVAGILGILKAGGAYVPLDLAYPKERLAFMLEDTQVPVLLTQERLVEELPEQGPKIVCLDADWEVIAQESQENPISGVTADNLAYVIYTSGSTGKPKGTLISHYNVVRLFEATHRWFHFDERDVWTLFHTHAFDFSVWELWGALIYGGRLVVVPFLVSRSPEMFYELLRREQVTVLNQTPSAFRQLAWAEGSLGAAEDLALRLVIFGGEALELNSLRPWYERHGDQCPQLVNMYGITETTVHVTHRPLKEADLNDARGSVIGGPIPDLQVYILDQYLQPAPIGVPGEIYVGGAGLSCGYLDRPKLTAERFVPNPFGDEPGARLYKSGDLGRYLPNGDIEYLGRIDYQVKIRGFRIELGEIEAILGQYPAVRETVVLAREDVPDEKRLVAYIVSNQEDVPTTSELRSFLAEKLPDYMVPSVFVFLDDLPLTPNGKIDRRALPVPDIARPDLDESFAAPRTPEEKALASIWAQVLGLERVGAHDNFFDLGGDSIRSIQVLSQAREQGLDISLQQLFKHQTIYELARELEAAEISAKVTGRIQPFGLISQEDRQRLAEDVEDAYPLTKLQAGLLFHSRYNSDSALYHDIFTFHLRAPLDPQALRAALDHLAARHPVLRTSFDLSNFSEPLQLVHQTTHIPLQEEDLRHLSPVEQEDALAVWIAAEKGRHFDWTRPPLLRFQVHRRSEKTFQLSLSFHHAVLDGWSVASMLTELFQHYLSLLGKQPHPLEPPPTAAFRDFVALEREALESDECRDYWGQELSGNTVTMLPRWPSHHREADVRQVRRHEVSLSDEVSEGLKWLARSAGIPLKSVLLAAHLRVLSLLSGQSDVLTGLGSHGRPEGTDGERALGLFLNVLPFRLKLSGGTWIDLARETFEAERESLPFRRYPLAELQRISGGQPLFETVFNFIHYHVYQSLSQFEEIQLLGAEVFEETNFTLVAHFSLDPFSSRAQLVLNYDAAELCDEQIKAMGDYYTRTLAAMVSEPFGRYESHVSLSERECHQLLVEWNDTQTDYPKDKCVHELFEAQVERAPDAVALIFGAERLTYRELNRRANQLAHHLRALGVGPEVPVGICVERSLEMVVGILGILKAGGAYIPLDPAYPRERLAFMLEDAQASVLLTQQRLVERLPEHGARVVCLDTDWEAIAQESQENPVSGTMAKNLAYVIYTSGSTGRPKGVQIEHRGLLNLVFWHQRAFAVSPVDRATQVAGLAFDASVWELWPYLAAGASIHIPDEERRVSPVQLRDWFVEEGVTISFLPTPLAEAVLSLEWPHRLALRTLLTGGEKLHRYPAPSLPFELVNNYGPTEDTVVTTSGRVPPREQAGVAPSIGRPIANTQVYLLDPYLQPVPIGVPGELYIGGDGLARSYLNRPELTAETFIPNPFSDEPGARLYKTGDLVRYLPDGSIEFLGRTDHQVKIRGFRIELGEIEAVLGQHSGVRQAVALAWDAEREPGDLSSQLRTGKRLVAYIVPHPKQAPTTSDLRHFLQERLPDYMVPSAFVLLASLPLTPNGKVDRRALPAPGLVRPEMEDAFVTPRNPVEDVLAGIWAEVLGLERVGVHDNFFALGGHSLLAIQIASRVRDALQVELPLRSLLERPTIAELSKEIEEAKGSGAEPQEATIVPVSREAHRVKLSSLMGVADGSQSE